MTATTAGTATDAVIRTVQAVADRDQLLITDIAVYAQPEGPLGYTERVLITDDTAKVLATALIVDGAYAGGSLTHCRDDEGLATALADEIHLMANPLDRHRRVELPPAPYRWAAYADRLEAEASVAEETRPAPAYGPIGHVAAVEVLCERLRERRADHLRRRAAAARHLVAGADQVTAAAG